MKEKVFKLILIHLSALVVFIMTYLEHKHFFTSCIIALMYNWILMDSFENFYKKEETKC